MVNTEQYNVLATYGQFEVSSVWPAYEPWGGHPDMYRTLRMWDSDLHRPVDEVTYGHQSRWSHPDLDVVIDKLEKIGFDDPELIPLAIEGPEDRCCGDALYSYLTAIRALSAGMRHTGPIIPVRKIPTSSRISIGPTSSSCCRSWSRQVTSKAGVPN
ncbi:MAG: hypothetical protein ACOX3I_08705 [Limnochordia bacterium]